MSPARWSRCSLVSTRLTTFVIDAVNSVGLWSSTKIDGAIKTDATPSYFRELVIRQTFSFRMPVPCNVGLFYYVLFDFVLFWKTPFPTPPIQLKNVVGFAKSKASSQPFISRREEGNEQSGWGTNCICTGVHSLQPPFSTRFNYRQQTA